MSLTVSHGLWPFSHCLSSPMELLHVSHCLLLFLAVSLTVPPSTMELLQVSHCLLLLLAVSHCPYGPMELLHVSHYLPCLQAVSHCHSQFHGVHTCRSLSLILTLSLTLFMELLHVSQSLPWSLAVSHCLSSPME